VKSTTPFVPAATNAHEDVETTDATLLVAQLRNGIYADTSLVDPPSMKDTRKVCSFARNTGKGGADCDRLLIVTG
jgi:hypothetical protein